MHSYELFFGRRKTIKWGRQKCSGADSFGHKNLIRIISLGLGVEFGSWVPYSSRPTFLTRSIPLMVAWKLCNTLILTKLTFVRRLQQLEIILKHTVIKCKKRLAYQFPINYQCYSSVPKLFMLHMNRQVYAIWPGLLVFEAFGVGKYNSLFWQVLVQRPEVGGSFLSRAQFSTIDKVWAEKRHAVILLQQFHNILGLSKIKYIIFYLQKAINYIIYVRLSWPSLTPAKLYCLIW